MSRRLILHIGASKTGTSALQDGLFGSVESLGRQGVGVPLVGRDAHVARVLRPLGWRTSKGFVRPVDAARLGRLVPLLRSTPGERLLMTNEDLCEADDERIRALVGTLEQANLEVEVVLSLRTLVSVLPSEWQQFLKHRLTLDYPTFLRRVRDRSGPAARHFWQRQDAAATLARWSAVVGADHVHVVITPDRASDPDGLYRMFGEIVGYDPATLSWPERDVNASWGYVEAEVYRRLNVALGDRLPGYDRDYQPAVRWPLVKGVLPRSASTRIVLPSEHVDWVREQAVATRETLRASGVRVHGDLDALVPGPEAGRDLPAPDEAAVAQAAVETLANFAVSQHRSARRRRAVRGRAARTTTARGPRLRRLLPQVARRAARRVSARRRS